MAWKAPRALKAPIFCWFSHLKKRLNLGVGEWEPLEENVSDGGSSLRKAAGLGEEAIRSRVWLVIRGVRWMYLDIFARAMLMDSGARGGAVDASVIVRFFYRTKLEIWNSRLRRRIASCGLSTLQANAYVRALPAISVRDMW